MEIQFATNSYRSDSLPISAQRCVNAYAEFQPRGAKTPIAVWGSPGIGEFGQLGAGPVRAVYEMNGIGYAVSGQYFYRFDENGLGTILGAGITGNNVVSIDGSGFQIAITNSQFGYVYDLAANTFTQISDPDFFPSNTVKVINLYFVFDKIDSNKFFISNLLDAAAYDAFAFASAESHPDRVKAVSERNGILLVMGEKTIEPWDHTGATDFPFQRFKGGTINRGIKAPLALENEESATFFLGDDLGFYMLVGSALRRISTPAIEKEWGRYAVTSDAFCFKINYGGHTFIHVTFPTAQRTWACDLTTGFLWHERQSYDPTGAEVRWRANCVTTVYGKQIIGDANSGRLGFLNPDINTEFGQPIIMKLASPPIHQRGAQGSMPYFELDMETGVGKLSGQGSNPQIMMRYSDDGGSIWSDAQLWRTMGALGRRETRLQWDSLGTFRQRVIEVSVSDDVRRRVIAARCPYLYYEDRP
jgi:hypothetical protein